MLKQTHSKQLPREGQRNVNAVPGPAQQSSGARSVLDGVCGTTQRSSTPPIPRERHFMDRIL